MVAFIVDPFFFEKIDPSYPVNYILNGTHYKSAFYNQLTAMLQQHGCEDSAIFIQNGAPPHIATPMK